MYNDLFDYASKRKTVPKIYISGPMTGVKHHNLPAFRAMAEKLRGLGFNVFNPGENPVRPEFTWEMYMKWDLKNLLDCDMIIMLDGWEDSRGARMELYVAQEMKIPEITLAQIEQHNVLID